MKAKRLITLALPIMLLSACTTETYGLTQAEFRKVDKEFKADKMIKDMKRMHYSDEEIEKQLRGALATITAKQEEAKKKSKPKEEIQLDSYSKEEKSDTGKSKKDIDNVEGYPTDKVDKKDVSTKKLSEKEYVTRLFELRMDLQQEIDRLDKEIKTMFDDGGELTKPTIDAITDTRLVLNELEAINPPKKHEEFHEYVIKLGIKDSREALNRVEEDVRKFMVGSISTARLKEVLEKGMRDIDSGPELWETSFEDFEKEFPGVQQKVMDKKQKEIKDANEGTVNISANGKELVADWGTYRNGEFNLGFDLKKDGTFLMYESEDKEERKQTHMLGEWKYDGIKKIMTFTYKKFIEHGSEKEGIDLPPYAEFKVLSFNGDTFEMMELESEVVMKARKR
ncbi:hypothetical protein IEK_05211 [Bacillus toyonensis]|uniref:DUF3994 domain-containing protein n=1 Tax=Bacillus toyonensis TaxID=155322 RepID=UPI00027BF1A9|nr:DUF3994 domain-containing protein [Bacillus toyonensis]EJV43872.1 hypothetical protein IEK_05211 [Bacillus toyonensis]PHD85745.1 hypothetical protein COF50_13960 [Bacillus toyonensis]